MGSSFVVKVADINGTVGAEAYISRAEPCVVRIENRSAELCADGAAYRCDRPPGKGMPQKIACNEFAVVYFGKRIAQVNRATRRRSAGNLGTFKVWKVMKGMTIVQRTCLAEAL